ncbi:MAG: SMC-Scp complex subunit ScpB [Candidatus Zixiibacteriota bacterium]|nr:MAG: SMC-Scp complex subunit ScpB [candidate division Zixibacteria bacterium]
MNNNGLRLPIIESLILSSPEPLPARKISEIIDDISPGDIEEVVELLNERYMQNDSSFRIRQIAGGYQVYILESYSRYVEELLTRRRNIRLTRAALETLAIIAYRQPVTKTDIETIRGVASDSVIHTLLERKLITLAGRAETVGRPLLYRTTDEFLRFFNVNRIEDLPRMEEIEELLASEESDGQPSLPLADRSNGAEIIVSPAEPSGSEPGESDAEESDETGEPAEAYPEPEPAEDQSDDYIDEKETVGEAQSWSRSFKTQE